MAKTAIDPIQQAAYKAFDLSQNKIDPIQQAAYQSLGLGDKGALQASNDLENPLLSQMLIRPGVGLNQVSPAMQMITNALHPGSEAPTLGQSLKDVASGVGQYGQSLLQNIMRSPMGGGVPGIGMAQAFQPMQQASNAITNFNIPNAMNIQSTPMNQALQTGAGDVAAYGPAAMGAARLGITGLGALADTVFPQSSASLMKSISKQLPQFTKQKLFESEMQYKNSNNLMAQKVDTSPYLEGQSPENIPTDQELRAFVPKGLQSGNFDPNNPATFQYDALNNPQIRKIAMDQWKSSASAPSNVNKIFDDETEGAFSPATRKIYNTFQNDPTGFNLKNLRNQLQQEYYDTDNSSVAGQIKRQLYQPAFQKADKMIQGHLSQDPNALQGWLNGNAIRSQFLHPIWNTPALNNMSKGTAGLIKPVSAANLVNDAQTAVDSGQLNPANPFFQKAQQVSQALQREQNPGLIKGSLGLLGKGLLLGTGMGAPYAAYKELQKYL